MKKKRRILAILLCLIACFGLSITSYAALFYEATYTDGKSYGKFKVVATSSVGEYSVQTQGFDGDTTVVINIFDSSGLRVNTSSTVMGADETRKNEKLVKRLPKGTYTIEYQVRRGSGWIGVWMF